MYTSVHIFYVTLLRVIALVSNVDAWNVDEVMFLHCPKHCLLSLNKSVGFDVQMPFRDLTC